MRTSLFWFTKDLRLREHPGLHEAGLKADSVLPVYVWDEEALEDEADNRKLFLLESLRDLDTNLRLEGSGLLARTGNTAQELLALCRIHNISDVYCSESRDPATKRLQESVSSVLGSNGIALTLCPGNYLLSPDAITTATGSPYRVYTPYAKSALKQLHLATRVTRPRRLMQVGEPAQLPSLSIAPSSPLRQTGGESAAQRQWAAWKGSSLKDYAATRNDLSNESGVSRMSAYLNFGAISVRQIVDEIFQIDDPDLQDGKTAYLNELLWREFNYYIAHHFPFVLHRAFREELSFIQWQADHERIHAWKDGLTGYPVVDAAMRQLKETGWMHNRARMIVASFLVKDLLIDWQEGEAWFMEWLTDGDAVQNNAGWQWSASTGVDAQPYFRIFNPITQGKRFDPHGEYVRRYVPELRHRSDKTIYEINIGDGYPNAIVDHQRQREKALAMFKEAMNNYRK